MSSENDFNIKSIQFKTWLYFFLMAVIILAILWFVQILFFSAYYQSMKKIEIDRDGRRLEDAYHTRESNEQYQVLLEECALTNGANIVLFEVRCDYVDEKINLDQESFKMVFISSQYGGEPAGSASANMLNEEFFKKAHKSERFSYISSRGRGEYIVYGAILEGSKSSGEKMYLQISSALVPMDATASVLKNQLIIVTIICLLLSVILSWLISKRISKPITEFSKVARRLAKGDYNVRFKGNGYSEIEDLAETLNYATQEMSKTESLRRDFLANVSHDLRTPLTMVKAYAEMIRDISGKDELKRTEHSQVIIDEADRLTNLVNDILNLSKLQAGTVEEEKLDVSLAMLSKQVLERFDIMRERNGYNFTLNANGNCVVEGDSSRIEQVLYNLIGNAINYTGEDKKVSVTVKEMSNAEWKELRGQMRVNMTEETPEQAAEQEWSVSRKVFFAVSDTGKGIAQDDIEAVWDRYYRANQSKRKVVGTGLGLSIVKSVLIKYNADFGIKSAVGEGSTFWFCMDGKE